jgi:hypothetical protein
VSYRCQGKFLADNILQASPLFYPGEGHISMIHKHAETIISRLMG